MNAKKVGIWILLLGLLVSVSPTASAAELWLPAANGGCAVGEGYDPSCDVDRSGLIDVVDIMLVAGHWREEGTWSSDSWGLTGNAGTDPSTNFLGTSDGQDLIINPDGGGVGIGTTNPQDKLVVGDGVSSANVRIPKGGLCIDSNDCNSPGDGGLRVGEGGIHGTDTSNDDLYLVPDKGEVGIGTTNPQAKLHVVGSMTASGNIIGKYGGGKANGMANYTNHFHVGTLPYGGNSTFEKLLVTVWGGSWYNTTLGQDFFSISSRGGLKVTRTRLFGGTSKFTLQIYDNGSNYDVVVQVVSADFPSLLIRSVKLETSTGFAEQPVTGGYDPSGHTNVTPSYDNHIILNNSGQVGIGTDNPSAKLDVDGTSRTKVLQITGGSDLAEPFDIVGAENVEPGMAVVIDPENPGQLRIADEGYDRMVAGIVSGANGLNAGITMQQDGAVEGSFPVALSGRVYGLADASYGAIRPGDLLTTSDTPGHVRKVTDHEQAQGAIVGKAMSALDGGQGLVLVLVTLQ